MRYLFQAALLNKRHYLLFLVAFVAVGMLTVASQLEIFALRVLTDKGPDFFELFAVEKEGKLLPRDSVTLQQVEGKWRVLSKGKEEITRKDAERYLTKWKGKNKITRFIAYLEEKTGLTTNLVHLAWFVLAVAIFKAFALFGHRYTIRLVSIRVSRDLRQAYFEHIQSLPMSFYQQYQIGSLSSRVVSDAGVVSDAINASLANYFQTPLTLITTLILCFLNSWHLSLVIFIGLPMLVFPIIFLAQRVRRLSRQLLANQERFASVLIDFLAGIQTVKVFAMEDFSLRKYREHNIRMAKLEQRSARYDSSARPIIHSMATVCISTVIVYGLYVLHMSVSEIVFFCGCLLLFYEPIKKFAEENTYIQRGVAAAERMFEVLSLRSVIEDAEGAEELQEFHHSLEFEDVWFRYQDRWVLRGLSFTIKKGEMVALVGPTGAGKSTVVQLLPRLYDVQQGRILVDGKPLQAYTQRSLRENMAFVPQRPFLFLDTVAANISYGRDFSMEEIKEAARQAHAAEFIEQLPQGYHSELLEAGKNLSGGQQQRLAIARAMVKKAPILIMDEATSALDMVSELRIKEAIHSLKGKVTQIVIAHRLSTIEDADKIIFLDQGTKIAEGTKDELLEICPPFRAMWEAMHTPSLTGV